MERRLNNINRPPPVYIMERGDGAPQLSWLERLASGVTHTVAVSCLPGIITIGQEARTGIVPPSFWSQAFERCMEVLDSAVNIGFAALASPSSEEIPRSVLTGGVIPQRPVESEQPSTALPDAVDDWHMDFSDWGLDDTPTVVSRPAVSALVTLRRRVLRENVSSTGGDDAPEIHTGTGNILRRTNHDYEAMIRRMVVNTVLPFAAVVARVQLRSFVRRISTL